MVAKADVESLLVASLKDFGLTEYEARIYVVLSRDFPGSNVSASELSKVSGIAYTKIYSVLSSLNKKGLVEIMRGKPALYRLAEPLASFDRLKEESVSNISKAHDLVLSSIRKISSDAPRRDVQQRPGSGSTWNIEGKINVINKLSEQVDKAHKNLKIIFPNLRFLDSKILNQISSRSTRVKTSLIVSESDQKFLRSVGNADVRYNHSLKSRYALFDDKYSLMIALDTPNYWTGVFETCGNCTRQAYEHFDLAWKGSRVLRA
ncbi:MAG: TrmB family transcriptional regulator [Nitrososphaerales archaeon]